MNDSPSTDSLPTVALPLLLRSLDRARHLLARAAAHARAHGLDEAALLRLRLAPDMFCLGHQVIVLAESLAGVAAQLSGQVEAPCAGWVFNRGDETQLAPTDRCFADAIARADAAHAALAGCHTLPAAAATLRVARPGHVRCFTVADFVWHYAVPNAYFHLSMIYALLRHAGVPLGKADFEGAPVYHVDAGRV